MNHGGLEFNSFPFDQESFEAFLTTLTSPLSHQITTFAPE